jgi:transcriptional regulator with XRE-family HTH domain
MSDLISEINRDPQVDERQILKQLGLRIKAIRIAKNMTIADLSTRSGVSESLISQVERGLGNPAFMTLIKLTQGLEIETAELFSNGDPSAAIVIHPEDRIKMKIPGRGVFNERLTPEGFCSFTALITKYEPHSSEEQPYNHAGGETMFIAKGTFEFHYGNRTYMLQENDAINFRGEIPHWGQNPGSIPAILIMIIEDR